MWRGGMVCGPRVGASCSAARAPPGCPAGRTPGPAAPPQPQTPSRPPGPPHRPPARGHSASHVRARSALCQGRGRSGAADAAWARGCSPAVRARVRTAHAPCSGSPGPRLLPPRGRAARCPACGARRAAAQAVGLGPVPVRPCTMLQLLHVVAACVRARMRACAPVALQRLLPAHHLHRVPYWVTAGTDGLLAGRGDGAGRKQAGPESASRRAPRRRAVVVRRPSQQHCHQALNENARGACEQTARTRARVWPSVFQRSSVPASPSWPPPRAI